MSKIDDIIEANADDARMVKRYNEMLKELAGLKELVPGCLLYSVQLLQDYLKEAIYDLGGYISD